MSWPTDIDAEPLACVYLVANTPAYLYRQLRRQPAVAKLAADFSSESLLATLRTILDPEKRTLEDIAKAYSLLAAVSLQRYSLWWDLVRRVDLSKLSWGDDFRLIMTTLAVQIDVTDVRASSDPAGLSASPQEVSFGTLTVRPNLSPKTTVSR